MSIVAPQQSAATPSIVTLGEGMAIDPSIVAATPAETGPSPSIVALADNKAADAPSVVWLGEPPATGEAASPHRMSTPMLIRGGAVGHTSARPSSAAAAPEPAPLLDPNDRGTPGKRRALKRQAERLAQEQAAGGNAQPDPSMDPVPLGR